MFSYFNIETDIIDFETKLAWHQKLMPRIAKRMMAKAMAEIKKAARDDVKGKVLNTKTGRLARSFKFKANSDFTGWIANNNWRASFHEKGCRILPSKAKYLMFKVNDSWIKSKGVTLPARPFLSTNLNEQWNSGQSEKYMNDVFQEALDSIYEGKL